MFRRMPKTAPFIAFEGLDGSGKTTLIRGIEVALAAKHLGVIVTREPGGTVLGDEIRALLLKIDGVPPSPRAEALLYQAGRAQHVETKIRPALDAGKWVLSDRFAASSLAFQGEGRDLGQNQIEWLNEFSTGGLKPDLYVLLDLTVESSAKRLGERGGEVDRIESENRAFFERVRAAYLAMAEADPTRWLVISAELSRPAILARTLQHFGERRWLD